MQDRLERLRQELAERNLDAMLIARPENRTYLSGFTGSSGLLLVTAAAAYLITDFRYVEQAAAQAPGFQVERVSRGPGGSARVVAQLAAAGGCRRVGFESDYLSVDEFHLFDEVLAGVELEPAAGAVERLREVKDDGEIAAIRRAAQLADAAFDHILGVIKPGLREREVALELEFFLRKSGAEQTAFDSIVASGPRSSLPHGVATDREIGRNELITLDFGCVMAGYCSDMTRTIIIGEPDEKQRQVYEVVQTAQARGLELARPGLVAGDLDAACREVIAAAGFAQYFEHSTGHGVGRVVHEAPRIAAGEEQPLVAGHIVTVEPGVYIPGWGGVRIEDLVLITPTGHEVLSRSPKTLIILD